LTVSPAASSPRFVRTTVSGTTSNRIVLASTATTVKHAPLIAIESFSATPSAIAAGASTTSVIPCVASPAIEAIRP